jgi:hypothetical protein
MNLWKAMVLIAFRWCCKLLPCGEKTNFSLSKIGRCITCDRAKEKAR